MRIREWYSYHFPELIKIVSDNYMYAKCAHFIKSRKDFNEDKLEGLEEIVMDEGKAKAILTASRSSMGMDISPIDLINIECFSQRVIGLIEYRKKLHEYLQSKMGQVAPNLQALIGDLVGARLISHAGSLTNLSKYPASTVQILGAEKALFRALKTKGNTPKYGLIFHSSFIGRASQKNKGRISRYLANKASIAARIDSFSDEPTILYGIKLREQVEDRLEFYSSGKAPKKNIDVMAAVRAELDQEEEGEEKKEKKKRKKPQTQADEEETEGKGEEEKKKKKNLERLRRICLTPS
jgi:RNA processing factor Prp31